MIQLIIKKIGVNFIKRKQKLETGVKIKITIILFYKLPASRYKRRLLLKKNIYTADIKKEG